MHGIGLPADGGDLVDRRAAFGVAHFDQHGLLGALADVDLTI